MPAVFVPTATPQLTQQGFSTTPQADTRITSTDPSKNFDPVVKMAQAYEQFEQKQQEEQDTADALSASNNFTLEAQKRLVDLENKENDAAAEDYKTFDTDLIESQKKNGSNLNGRSLKLYNKLTQDKLVTLQAGGYAFNAKRANTQITQELVASADNASQQAVSTWGTPMFQANMNSLDESLKAVAVHQGIDLNSDKFKELLRKGHADVYKAGIASQIQLKQYGSASRSLSQFAPEMDQYDVLTLRTGLQSAMIADAQARAAKAQEEQEKLNDKLRTAAANMNAVGTSDGSLLAAETIRKIKPQDQGDVVEVNSLLYKFSTLAKQRQQAELDKILKANDEKKANFRTAAWNAFNDFKSEGNEKDAEIQARRYLANGGDFDQLRARDDKLALKLQAEKEKKLKEQQQAKQQELDKLLAEDRRNIATAKDRNDIKAVHKYLQSAVDHGMSKEEAHNIDDTFIYQQETKAKQEAQAQLEKEQAKEQEASWSAYLDYNKAGDRHKALEQVKRYIRNGGDPDKIKARDVSLAKQAMDELLAEDRRKIADAEQRNDNDAVNKYLQDAVNHGMSIDEAKNHSSTFVYKQQEKQEKEKQALLEKVQNETLANAQSYFEGKDLNKALESLGQALNLGVSKEKIQALFTKYVNQTMERQQQQATEKQKKVIADELEFASRASSQGRTKDVAQHLENARIAGLPKSDYDNWVKYYLTDAQIKAKKEADDARNKSNADLITAAGQAEADGHYEQAFDNYLQALNQGASNVLVNAKITHTANMAADERLKQANNMFEAGNVDRGEELLSEVVNYAPFITNERMEGFLLSANKTRSQNFVKLIEQLEPVSKTTALNMIDARGQQNLTPTDYAKLQTIRQKLVNEDQTSTVNTLIADKDGKGLGDLLFKYDETGRRSLSSIAQQMKFNQPDLYKQAVQKYGEINREASESHDKEVEANKGLPTGEKNAYERQCWDNYLDGDPNNDNDGAVMDILRQRKLEITDDNKALIRAELMNRPDIQAQISKQVENYSRSVYEKVDANARRHSRNVTYGVNLVNRAIADGKVSRAELSSVENPLSLLPDVQKELQSLFGDTDDEVQNYTKVVNQVNRAFNKDVIGNVEKEREIVSKISEWITTKTEGEFNLEVTELQSRGVLNQKQADSLNEQFRSALQKRFDSTAKDLAGSIRDLMAGKMYSEDTFGDCSPDQQTSIVINMRKLYDKAREVTHFSNDINALPTGLKIALTDPVLQEDMGLTSETAEALGELLDNGDLGDAMQDQVNNAKIAKFKRENASNDPYQNGTSTDYWGNVNRYYGTSKAERVGREYAEKHQGNK